MPEQRRSGDPLPLHNRRRNIRLDSGATLSALSWGTEPAELLFLHGAGQNAHTWDTTIARIGRPAIALDLPGHGHSSWRADQDYSPATNARAVSEALTALAAAPRTVVGMSLGGLTAIALLGLDDPGRSAVDRLAIVDIAPRETDATPARDRIGSVALLSGPREFDSLDAMIAAAAATAPDRDPAALARGVRFNAVELPSGRWAWRYDPAAGSGAAVGGDALWNALAAQQRPVLLVLGGDSSFVSADDLARYHNTVANLRVETIVGAGHSVQSDQPERLAEVLADFALATEDTAESE